MFSAWIARVSGIAVLSLAVCAAASAQYGGGSTGTGGTGSTGSTPNYSYGNGKAIGIGVGAAAAVAVGAALLIHHHHVVARSQASLVGCTQSLMDGISLKNENDNQTYMILSKGTTLQPGERVELKGVVTNDGSGGPAFRVQSVVNNFGSCGTASAAKSVEEKTELAQAVK